MPKSVNYLVLFIFSFLIVLYAALLSTPVGESLTIHFDAPVWMFLQCVIAQWLTLKVYRTLKQKQQSLVSYISKVFIVSNVVFTLCISVFITYLESLIGIQKVDSMHVIATFGMSSLLHMLVAAYSIAFELVTRLQAQQAALANKEKALLDSQVKTLQQHIDPHFLFNNLNVLSALILKSPEEAEEYLETFSDIYRYILENKSKNLVPLAKELVFIKDYMALIETRFNGLYRLRINVDNALLANRYVIPCSLQLAIENAVKHNGATVDNPLDIHINVEVDGIVVTNNLNEKEYKPMSTGLGLAHLQAQCKAVFNRQSRIEKNESVFILTLPMTSEVAL
ncbi:MULTISPECIES: histidine kinase [Pseudoalteromonas]|uniref:sensor histidine kinase n=1 Tax=Pseudoalteromonas TaxID=53246 RepID=UPI000C53DC11|nr:MULTISPECIES: histidine kinase [Pseudoalteromonas]MAY58221.1 hypothetical protein [Pseudoalteromonas sp.]MDN3408043.1 histidine kinase [Pseudoalteromonas sp. APC 3894]MDN3415683.1 histidine kinase [Pseudoalteromonas sp. APC 3227]MDN3419381.1 histidine kinase [Pseudoalteromonas sp. APC 3895]MDN3422750.1 histidine kinase [Pseudoalteromonas sp. APC 3896]|tara:strand:- start:2787 stop:3800 length:1014 start_codon:yes stop_codon:yes gene_type:complete